MGDDAAEREKGLTFLQARWILISIVTLWLCACVDYNINEDFPINIIAVAPELPKSGSFISIAGEGFGIQGEEDQVTLSGISLEVRFWQNDRIDCRLPELENGQKILVIQANGYTSEPHFLYIRPEIEEADIFIDQGSPQDGSIDALLGDI